MGWIFFFQENKPAKSARIVHCLQILRGFYYCFQWAGKETDFFIWDLCRKADSPTHSLSIRERSILECLIYEKVLLYSPNLLRCKADIPIPSGYYSHKGRFSVSLCSLTDLSMLSLHLCSKYQVNWNETQIPTLL